MCFQCWQRANLGIAIYAEQSYRLSASFVVVAETTAIFNSEPIGVTTMRRLCIQTTQVVEKGYISLTEKWRVLLQSVTNKRHGVTPAQPTSANGRLRKFWLCQSSFASYPEAFVTMGNWDSAWRQYHVNSLWKIPPPQEIFSTILNVFCCCLWLLFREDNIFLVWRFWIIILKIIS